MASVSKLVKIFDEYDNITIRGKSNFGRYDAIYKLVKVDGATITLSKLIEYVQSLQKRFPDKNFRLRSVMRSGKQLFCIDKKSYMRTPDGKIKTFKDRVPIYFDLDEQAIYVPKSYLKYQKRLAHYVLMRTLGALGLARVRYVSTT